MNVEIQANQCREDKVHSFPVQDFSVQLASNTHLSSAIGSWCFRSPASRWSLCPTLVLGGSLDIQHMVTSGNPHS